ncbi:hypothetical protein SDRG_16041 [Saprolegnia diclina VS20]|uniref:HIT domain-containing protein n=1 Tax=Saprolegnia diclina (strain VS20) TaxID=1156394 RepID=T0PL36_SAPDV|nr:hypothetical protein SDRG_16041 [Saprolegnia diclina VS20]EQC26089.1 hypothetical protein SDRG_16041 [Saprolegnia diclina VS20]|eukprot:XP_008620456.1 hypothetical protein SDRG_16041 [Saprolegnia diclina VS20]
MVKVLLCGDVGSAWPALRARVEKLHASAHGPFNMVLCTGACDVSALDDAAWPLPVYALAAPGTASTAITNLHLVSTNSVLELCGLQVAFLADEAAGAAFAAALAPVDVLVTAAYPDGFDALLPDKVPVAIQHVGSKEARLAAQAAVPRYHIVGTHGVFYQHLPYVTDVPSAGRRVSRLIGLGHVGASADKDKKWLHALNLEPLQEGVSVEIPPGTTQSPFQAKRRGDASELGTKRLRTDGLSADKVQKLTQQSQNAGQFRYDPALAAQGQGAHEQIRRPVVANRSECWFCLATPTVETHLIVSIGDEAYVAIPKGPIVPDHVLIIPIQHVSSMRSLSPAAAAEVDKFKSALEKLFASQGKSLIFMDRNVSTLGAAHAHLQVIPVPADALAHVAHICFEEGKQYNVDFEMLSPDAPLPTSPSEYFLVSFPDGAGGYTRLYHAVRGKHYMQFGRHVAATLLDMPRRENWKYCVVPKDEETAMTDAFRKAFAPFDFAALHD